MASEKKIKRLMFGKNQNKKISDLTIKQQDIFMKINNKMMNEISGKGMSMFNKDTLDAKAFPCQMMKGKYAIIPANAKPQYNQQDGKWYLDEQLIISDEYLNKIAAQEAAAKLEQHNQSEKDITQLKPQKLGEE